MKTAPATHTSFFIAREFDAPPEAVFQAWADPEVKRAWSDCHAEHTTAYSLDFRPLGHEHHEVRYPDGRVQVIDKVFFDITEPRRIVFAYDIALDARRLSVSLVTVEFSATKRGTHMAYHEQLAYLDGHEDRAQRLQGTEESLDRLGRQLG
ncbi:MAG: SRPBCC domain-containing protein [Rhizobacter sp.]